MSQPVTPQRGPGLLPAVLFAIVIGSVFLPVWVNSADSGRSTCGSLAFKSDLGGGARAQGCEGIGAYRDRLVVTIVASAALATVVAHRLQQLPPSKSRLVAALGLGSTVLAGAALSAVAWSANDDLVRLAPYPYGDIEVNITSDAAEEPGFYDVVVEGRRWIAPAPVIVTTCVAFPADCDMVNAIEVNPVGGNFDLALTVFDPAGDLTVAAFDEDVEYYTFTSVAPPSDVPIDVGRPPPTPTN